VSDVLVLGIETATAQVGAALVDESGLVGSFHVTRDRRHAETLVPAIRQLLETCSVELADIEAIGVDVGPGLFTGLRVGLATSKSMAFALQIPMVAVTSFEALASETRWCDAPVVAVIDARRGEVFHQSFREGEALGEPGVATPETIRDGLDADAVLIGDGAIRYAAVFETHKVASTIVYPAAGAVGRYCFARAVAGQVVSHDRVAPMYLRRPDAVANWATVSGQVSTKHR